MNYSTFFSSQVFGTESRWSYSVGFGFVVALLQVLTLPFCPRSPRYLLLKLNKEPETVEGIAVFEIQSHLVTLPSIQYQCFRVLELIGPQPLGHSLSSVALVLVHPCICVLYTPGWRDRGTIRVKCHSFLLYKHCQEYKNLVFGGVNPEIEFSSS